MKQFRRWLEERTQEEAAKLLFVSQKAISNWANQGIPLHRIRDVERVTGIPAGTLCPKHFGKQFDK